ncbi:MAG: carboxypeptidase-like regulatory domain-containing protein [Bryobacteraceae bacterium]
MFLLALAPTGHYPAPSGLAVLIKDLTGTPVIGAAATLTHERTGEIVRAQAMRPESVYFPSLRPGRYTLSISQPGFRTSVIHGVAVDPSQSRHVDTVLLPDLTKGE